MGQRWGDDGPPAEAYTRISDPARYADLHTDVADLVRELTSRYDVGLDRTPLARAVSGDVDVPAFHLVPARPASVSVTFALTRLPGLDVRVDGRTWLALPHCGCDACDETLDECREQLRDLVAAVVAGSLGERLLRAGDGWEREQWVRGDGCSWSSRTPVTGAVLDALRAALPDGRTRWEPWPTR